MRLTFNHARSLGLFVAVYKAVLAALAAVTEDSRRLHAFCAAAVGGYLVWGAPTAVNKQVNMYLLGRVMFGLAHVGMKYGYLPIPTFGE